MQSTRFSLLSLLAMSAGLGSAVAAMPQESMSYQRRRFRPRRKEHRIKGCHNFAGSAWPQREITTTAFSSKKTRRQEREAARHA